VNLLVAAGGVALSVAVAGGAAQYRFSSGVEAVRVDVLVTERGRPVTGLTAEDFEVRDEGVPQSVTLIGFERVPLNIVLVLDLSASVAGDRLDDLRRGCRALLSRLAPGDHAAIVGFSHMVILGSELTTDHARLRTLLDTAKPAGDTALVDATYTGMLVGESRPGRALVMVFSDGLDVSSWLPADRVLGAAKRSETVVYGIAMKGTRPAFLEDLTSQTGGRLLDVDARNLSATFLEVLNEFRERYLLSFTPQGVSRGGWHALTVTLTRRGGTVKARPGYHQ
jgi:VWFA-related protein